MPALTGREPKNGANLCLAVEDYGPPWLAKHHRLAPLEPVLSTANMHSVNLCQKCGSITRIPMITPCAHLLCSTCTSEDK